MNETPRNRWKIQFRLFRISKRNDLLNDENAFGVRMQGVSDMREFTQQWDLPEPLLYPWTKQKLFYKPTNAFRRFLKGG